jgi:transposase-like protein
MLCVYDTGVNMSRKMRRKTMIITEEQQQAVDMISDGHTYASVSRTLNIHINTLYKWRTKASFQYALLEKGHEASKASEDMFNAYIAGRVDGLVMSAMEALDVVLRSGESENARVAAAKYVLETFRTKDGSEEEGIRSLNEIDELKKALRIV